MIFSVEFALKVVRSIATIALSFCGLVTPPAHATVLFKAAGMKGASAEVEFYVTATKTYFFYLNLFHAIGDRQDQERVSQLLDSLGRRPDGQRVRLDPPIPLHLTVSRIDDDQSVVVLDGRYAQHTLNSHGNDY